MLICKAHEKESYCSTTSNTLSLEYFTIKDRLYLMTEKYTNQIVFEFNIGNVKITYSDIKNQSLNLAKNFMHLGLQKSDRIAFIMPNIPELLISYFACSLIGLISVPLEPKFSSDDLEYMILKTQTKAIILFNSPDNQKTIKQLFPEILNQDSKNKFNSKKFPLLSTFIFVDNNNDDQSINQNGVWSYKTLSSQILSDFNYEFPCVESDDVFAILFTVKYSNFLYKSLGTHALHRISNLNTSIYLKNTFLYIRILQNPYIISTSIN